MITLIRALTLGEREAHVDTSSLTSLTLGETALGGTSVGIMTTSIFNQIMPSGPAELGGPTVRASTPIQTFLTL